MRALRRARQIVHRVGASSAVALLAAGLLVWPTSSARGVDGFRPATSSERAQVVSDLRISKENRKCLWIQVWAPEPKWAQAGYGGPGTPGGIDQCPRTDAWMILKRSSSRWTTVHAGSAGVSCSLAKKLPKQWDLPCLPDEPKSPPVSLTGPRNVSQGDVLTVIARTRYRGKCTFNFLPDGPQDPQGLTDARVVGGRATATVSTRGWGIGTWKAWVQCGNSMDSYRLKVEAPAPPAIASVDVASSGWSWRRSYADEGYRGSLGALLENDSASMDAKAVSGIVNITDADGRLVDTTSWFVDAVGAGSNFWAAIEFSVDRGRPPFRASVVVKGYESLRGAVQPQPWIGELGIYPCDPEYPYSTDAYIVIQRTDARQVASGRVHVVAVDTGGSILGGSQVGFDNLVPGVPEVLQVDGLIANCSRAVALRTSVEPW